MTAGEELAPRLDHLALHRRMVLVRAVAAGMAGAVPAPFVDEWIASLVRRRAVRRLADLRRVDLSDEAARAIADGREPPPSWQAVFKGTALSMFLRRAWRRALLLLALARRADEIGRAFSVLTLFDHYCARLHVGAALELEEARRLRAAIDEALARTRGGLTVRLLKRGFSGTGRALLRAPFEIIDAATGGAVRRLLARNDEARAEEVLDDALERAASHEKSSLARAARALEAELASAGNAWQAELVNAFEAAWKPGR